MSIRERIQVIKNSASSVGFFSTNKNASNDEYMKDSELVNAWEIVSANFASIGQPETRRGLRARKNKDAEKTTKARTTTRTNPIIDNERGERE